MTIPVVERRKTYDGDGVSVDFAVPFKFLADSHLRAVDDNDAELTISAVSGAGADAGGSITLATAPATGTTVTIVGVAPLSQETDLTIADGMPADLVERAVDLLTIQNQEQSEKLDRAIKLPIAYDGGELTMPEPPAVAAVLGYDATGQLVASEDFQSLHDQAVAANTAAQAAQTAAEAAQAVAEAKAAELDTMLSWKVQVFEGTGTSSQELVLDADPGSPDRIFVVVDGLEVYNQAGSAGTWDYVLDNGTPKIIGLFAAPAPGYEGIPNVQVRYGVPSPYAEPPDGSITTSKMADGAVTVAKTAGLSVVAIVTGPYTVQTSDNQKLLRVGGATPSITLQSLTTYGSDFTVVIKSNSGLDTVITPDGLETIDGAATYTLKGGATDSVRLRNGGSRWIVESEAKTGGGIFSEEFESADLALVNGGSHTLAHGLGTIPKQVEIYLKCVVADLGYSVGDIITPYGSLNASLSSQGAVAVADATDIFIRMASPSIGITRKDTGAVATISTVSNWRIIVRAWA